jgi:hypothetical protein
MRRILDGGRMPVVIAAVLAALISGAGTAVAARLITSKEIKDGTIQIKDLSVSARGTLGARRGPQGAQGPAGPQGQAGAPGGKGDPGEPATRLWAVVNSPSPGNPIVVRGSGAIGVDDGADGNGEVGVSFNRDISACTYVGSVGGTDGDGGGAPFNEGSISTDLDTSNPVAVAVRTNNLMGVGQDLSFHLVVVC